VLRENKEMRGENIAGRLTSIVNI